MPLNLTYQYLWLYKHHATERVETRHGSFINFDIHVFSKLLNHSAERI